jgi:eukaryotic-like serine/threonine-protein kinase
MPLSCAEEDTSKKTPQIFSEELAIEEELGHGTYSTVYHAIYKSRPVAVKIMNGHRNAQSHLYREMCLLTKLQEQPSPHLAMLIGRAFIANQSALIFEYYPSGTLKKWLHASKKTPSWLVRSNIITNILAAIAYLHANGIVHLDIKDDNIFLPGNENEIKAVLGDFGFAVESGTMLERMLGTPIWMAPERFINHSPAHPSWDIYSFAEFLLELSTWSFFYKEFANKTPLQFIAFVTGGGRPTISNGCPDKIAHLIRLGWMPDAEKRPTANQMQDALPAALAEKVNEETMTNTLSDKVARP